VPGADIEGWLALRNLVIFDLDETLVHATEVALMRAADFKCASYFVYMRPHLSEMLTTVSALYDIAVWSSSSRQYVDQVVAQIFTPGVHLKFAWCIDQCVQRVDPHSGGYAYIKDLRKAQKFGYAVNRITMVDDSSEKVARQPRSHLMISPFEGDANDQELLGLANQLQDRYRSCNP
jgi:RNA polymerase II subunit A small phosphatase-like protein